MTKPIVFDSLAYQVTTSRTMDKVSLISLWSTMTMIRQEFLSAESKAFNRSRWAGHVHSFIDFGAISDVTVSLNSDDTGEGTAAPNSLLYPRELECPPKCHGNRVDDSIADETNRTESCLVQQ